jgi:hypothetical protein
MIGSSVGGAKLGSVTLKMILQTDTRRARLHLTTMYRKIAD